MHTCVDLSIQKAQINCKIRIFLRFLFLRYDFLQIIVLLSRFFLDKKVMDRIDITSQFGILLVICLKRCLFKHSRGRLRHTK